MSRELLDPRTADRLAKIAGLFGSEHAGERAEAAAKAHKLVRELGLTWHDVISAGSERRLDVASARPNWRLMARTCGLNAHSFNPREAKFISDMLVARGRPTDKQLDWLTRLYERVADDVAQRGEDRS